MSKKKKNIKSVKKEPSPVPKKSMAISLMFIALFMSLVYVFSGPNKYTQTSYSEFISALNEGQVTEVTISHDGKSLTSILL